MAGKVRYDEVAPAYDQRYVQHEYAGIAALLDELIDPAHVALEVGCGTGHWLDQVRLRSRCYGLDPSAGMLGKAVERLGANGLVRGRAEALPFAAASVDRIFVINALHHFYDPARFAREAFRLLRPQGRVAIVGLQVLADTPWFIYDYFPRTRALDEQRYPSTRQIADWLQQAGFVDCETRLAHHIELDADARDSLNRGLIAKASTSQLTLLSEAEYQEGMTRIHAATEAAEARGETLRLRADLDLMAVLGSRPLYPKGGRREAPGDLR